MGLSVNEEHGNGQHARDTTVKTNGVIFPPQTRCCCVRRSLDVGRMIGRAGPIGGRSEDGCTRVEVRTTCSRTLLLGRISMSMRKFRAGFSWAAISLLLAASLASAEPYLGLYAGAAFPFENDLKFGDIPLPGDLTLDLKARDERGDTSGLIGGKFGYFL